MPTIYIAPRAVSGVYGGALFNPRRRTNDWIPHITEPPVTEDGHTSEPHFRFNQEVARRLGGINGPTLPQLVQQNASLLSQVTALLATNTALAQQATTNAASIESIRAVLMASGTAGAASIPAANTTYVDPTPVDPNGNGGDGGGSDGGGD